jgi:ketosteroid isomerase-like protein
LQRHVVGHTVQQAMSQANVELTRRAFQAVNDRDLDALLATLDDDVEAVPILAAMEGSYHGHDGIRRWWAGLLGAFPDFGAEVVEVRELGDLTVAALRLRGRGAESNTPFDAAAWQVSQWRHRKCIWWRVYTSETEALEAVGQPE